MLGINPPTASLLLDEASDLKPGDWVVQNAANSGVGRSVIPIAKARGLKTINVVRRPELIPELEAIGGDLVVVDEDDAIDKIRDNRRQRSRAARHRRRFGQEQRTDRRARSPRMAPSSSTRTWRGAGHDQPVRTDREAHHRKGFFHEPFGHRAEDSCGIARSCSARRFRRDPSAHSCNLSSVPAGRSGSSCPARRKGAPRSSRKELRGSPVDPRHFLGRRGPKENTPMPNDTHETAPTRSVQAGDVQFAYRRFGPRGASAPVAPQLFCGAHGRLGSQDHQRICGGA